MKKSFLFGAMCFVAVLAMISCEPADPDNSGNAGVENEGGNNNGDSTGGGNGDGNGDVEETYTLIATPLTLEFAAAETAPQTVTVTTNAPTGYAVGETADWYTAVADGNKVTVTCQINEGDARNHTFDITAQGAEKVTITVRQAEAVEVHPSLAGLEYLVFQLDTESTEYLGDKITYSFAENGADHFMWVWDNTLVGDETATGPNFYGHQSGYVAFRANGAWWSGGAYAYAPAEGVDDDNTVLPAVWKPILDANGEGWYFHAAVKGTPNAGTYFTLQSANSTTEAPVSWTVSWNDYEYTESDWAEIEVPMTEVIATGWIGSDKTNTNILQFGGPGQQEKVHWDAVFIYKK